MKFRWNLLRFLINFQWFFQLLFIYFFANFSYFFFMNIQKGTSDWLNRTSLSKCVEKLELIFICKHRAATRKKRIALEYVFFFLFVSNQHRYTEWMRARSHSSGVINIRPSSMRTRQFFAIALSQRAFFHAVVFVLSFVVCLCALALAVDDKQGLWFWGNFFSRIDRYLSDASIIINLSSQFALIFNDVTNVLDRQQMKNL